MDEHGITVADAEFGRIVDQYRAFAPSQQHPLLHAITHHPNFDSHVVWEQIINCHWPSQANESKKALILVLVERERDKGVTLSFREMSEMYSLSTLLLGITETNIQFLPNGDHRGLMLPAFENISSTEEKRRILDQVSDLIGRISATFRRMITSDHAHQERPRRTYAPLSLASKVIGPAELDGEEA